MWTLSFSCCHFTQHLSVCSVSVWYLPNLDLFIIIFVFLLFDFFLLARRSSDRFSFACVPNGVCLCAWKKSVWTPLKSHFNTMCYALQFYLFVSWKHNLIQFDYCSASLCYYFFVHYLLVFLWWCNCREKYNELELVFVAISRMCIGLTYICCFNWNTSCNRRRSVMYQRSIRIVANKETI